MASKCLLAGWDSRPEIVERGCLLLFLLFLDSPPAQARVDGTVVLVYKSEAGSHM